MRNLLLVGLGGFLGSAARYWVVTAVSGTSAAPRFPLGTLVVNVVGSLLIGVVAGLAESRAWLGPETRLFVATGVLGGFTTFSAFALETHALARLQTSASALLNVALQLGLGLAAVWLGLRLAALVAR